ncbi:MAG: hypothetical protein IPJ43_06265 [Saprospiraceae bacterium]|nr:hypothetical protein [Saprospiraceae bacterium]
MISIVSVFPSGISAHVNVLKESATFCVNEYNKFPVQLSELPRLKSLAQIVTLF